MTRPDGDYQDVLDQLSVLAPSDADAPTAPKQALAQLSTRLGARKRSPYQDFVRSIQAMTSNRKAIMITGATAVLALVLLVGFPSVRAAASELLGLFRVETFTPISISPQQVAMLEQMNTDGFNPGEIVMEQEPGEPQVAANLSEAAAQTGYNVRTLSGMMGEPEIYVMPEAKAHMIVDLAGARAILEAAGIDPLSLPDSLDGARVDFNVFPSVQQVWSDGTVLMQTASPYVNYPADVDPAVLGEALLRMLGMDPAAARLMAQNIDWTSTMLLPIPREFATYQQIAVDGAPGVAIIPVDGSSESAILWQKSGTVYVLSGPLGAEGLLLLADNLR